MPLALYCVKIKMMCKRINIILLLFAWILYSPIIMAQKKEIILPPPSLKGKISLEEAIYKRRSQREFLLSPLTLEQVSQILWAANGVTVKKDKLCYRSAPSAGALYPIEIYALSKDGLFHYLPLEHKLEVIGEKDLREELSISAWNQKFIAQAPLTIVLCGVYQRTTKKYGYRGIRYVHMEAGHIAQNICLQATALDLASVTVGAFDDEQVKDLLSISDQQEPLYIISVGYPE